METIGNKGKIISDNNIYNDNIFLVNLIGEYMATRRSTAIGRTEDRLTVKR
jgi:hypothetical protein